MRGIRSSIVYILTIGLLAGSGVGVAAQDDLLAPAAVTGTITTPEGVSSGSRTWEDGALRWRDLRFTSDWEASDPRLSGAASITANRDDYEPLEMQVLAGSLAVENGDGRWVGPVTYLGGAELGQTMTGVVRGEDAYEGLTAVVVLDLGARTFAASIFPGEMPPIPEPASE